MESPKIKKIHTGRNVERIREIKGMKQETLAAYLGISQQAISKIEQSDKIDEEKLQKIAEALGVSVDAIKNFSEDGKINIVASTLHDTSIANNNFNPVYNFNPLDKIIALYDALLQSEKEKNQLLLTIIEKGGPSK